MDMNINYDPQVDILYLHFKNGVPDKIMEAGEDVIIELDEEGEIMGIEIWRASKRGILKKLKQITTTYT